MVTESNVKSWTDTSGKASKVASGRVDAKSGINGKWGTKILLTVLRSWKKWYLYPFGVFTCRTEVLKGVVQALRRPLDRRLSAIVLNPSSASAFKRHCGCLGTGTYLLSGSTPIIFLALVDFEGHRMSGTMLQTIIWVCMEYNGEGKVISRAGTTWLWIEKFSRTLRNSSSVEHLILQFYLQSKPLLIKSAGVMSQCRKKYFSFEGPRLQLRARR